jgi:predicted RNA-binding Zn-ribbon protein involved in translation (DUF1610 family)
MANLDQLEMDGKTLKRVECSCGNKLFKKDEAGKMVCIKCGEVYDSKPKSN